MKRESQKKSRRSTIDLTMVGSPYQDGEELPVKDHHSQQSLPVIAATTTDHRIEKPCLLFEGNIPIRKNIKVKNRPR